MKVILTESAEENLWQIYLYHSNYSIDYADKIQAELSDFIFQRFLPNQKWAHFLTQHKTFTAWSMMGATRSTMFCEMHFTLFMFWTDACN